MPIAIGYGGYIVRTIFCKIYIIGLEETIGVTLKNNFVVDTKFIGNYNLDRIEDLDGLARWSHKIRRAKSANGKIRQKNTHHRHSIAIAIVIVIAKYTLTQCQ